MGAHVVEAGQALGRDRAGDLALADAVAAADFRVIRPVPQRPPKGPAATPPWKRLAEDQRVAHLRYVGPASSSGR